MMPIRRAGVVAFMDWIRRTHKGVRSLHSLDEDDFMVLATEFENSKGLPIGPRHQVYEKWKATHYMLSHASSDSEALKNWPE